jgi:cellulose synthase/poly-beta-1,6-N-acetylglucosamine synthase-like glycosyltransferase
MSRLHASPHPSGRAEAIDPSLERPTVGPAMPLRHPPTVSVILPARDAGVYLAPAVASILGQSWADLELILIDDHSRDGALDRLPRDPRLRVFANRGRGVVAAMATGVEQAHGQYLARMDADDIALPQRLARQLECLVHHPTLAGVGAEVEVFTDTGPARPGFRRYAAWLNAQRAPTAIANQRFVDSPIANPTLLLRRGVYEALGGYRETAWAEDYDLILRILAHGWQLGKPRGILLRWRDTPDRLTRRDPRYSHWQLARAKAHYLASGPLRDRPALIWGAGPVGLRLADALLEIGAPLDGFIDVDPRKIGRQRRERPIRPMQALADRPDAVILAAVGNPRARNALGNHLRAMGRIEGHDFFLAA